jgi:hypothetical protein
MSRKRGSSLSSGGCIPPVVSQTARRGRATGAGRRRAWANGLALLALIGMAAGAAVRATPAGATTPESVHCAYAKQNAALKRLRAVNACYRAPSQLSTQPPSPACLDRANERFQRDFLRIESMNECVPVTGDAAAAANLADQCALNLVRVLPGMCLQAGSLCSGMFTPCCAGLVCSGAIGQSPTCQ